MNEKEPESAPSTAPTSETPPTPSGSASSRGGARSSRGGNAGFSSGSTTNGRGGAKKKRARKCRDLPGSPIDRSLQKHDRDDACTCGRIFCGECNP